MTKERANIHRDQLLNSSVEKASVQQLPLYETINLSFVIPSDHGPEAHPR
jgi:hypothetical protein